MGKVPVSVRLLKHGTEASAASIQLDKLESLEEFQLSADLEFAGVFFFRQVPMIPARWASAMNSILDDVLDARNAVASGLLLLAAFDRVWALSFGSGFQWINDDLIERRFGFETVLSAADDKIKRVDSLGFEGPGRTTQSKMAAPTDFAEFGIDVSRDVIRGVSAKPANELLGKNLSGSDGVKVKFQSDFSDLYEVIEILKDKYDSKAYRDRYPFVDNLKILKDPHKITRLDHIICGRIRKGKCENIYLSTPFFEDFDETDGFKMPNDSRGADVREDIDIFSFVDGVEELDKLTVNDLKTQYVRVYRDGSSKSYRRIKIYMCLVAEVRISKFVYCLNQGEWYLISKNFVKNVYDRLLNITRDNGDNFLFAKQGERESSFNERLCESIDGSLLLDAKNVMFGGGSSRIEICDVMTGDFQFYHIKKSVKSSMLSHLFLQGVNSATLLRDEDFRNAAIAKVDSDDFTTLMGDFHPNQSTIIYGIITSTDGDVIDALPFFSKLSLANAHRELTNAGYQVRVQKVQYEPD